MTLYEYTYIIHLHLFFDTESYCIAQAGIQITVLLLPRPGILSHFFLVPYKDILCITYLTKAFGGTSNVSICHIATVACADFLTLLIF